MKKRPSEGHVLCTNTCLLPVIENWSGTNGPQAPGTSVSVKVGQKVVKKPYRAAICTCKASEEVYSSRVNLQVCILKTTAVTEA